MNPRSDSLPQEVPDEWTQKELEIFSSNFPDLVRGLTKVHPSHPRVLEIRRDVLNFIVLFRDLHLKLANEFFKGLQDFMGNYTGEMEVEDFIADIDNICQEVSFFHGKAKVVVALHESLLHDSGSLLTRIAQAGEALDQEKIYCDRKATEKGVLAKVCSEQKAIRGRWAMGLLLGAGVLGVTSAGLACFPAALGYAAAVDLGVGVAVRGGVLCAVGAGLKAKEEGKAAMASSAAEAQKGEAQKASEILEGPTRDCVVAFTQAMSLALRFFETVKIELETCKEEALRADQASKERATTKVSRHFKKFRGPAKNIESMCRKFRATVPQLAGGLKAIAKIDSNDATYIQQWLEKHEGDLELTEPLDGRPGCTGWQAISEVCPGVSPRIADQEKMHLKEERNM